MFGEVVLNASFEIVWFTNKGWYQPILPELQHSYYFHIESR
jgi:hypothetical protein